MKELMTDIMETARYNLLTDKVLSDMAFMIKDGKVQGIQQIKGGLGRDMFYRQLFLVGSLCGLYECEAAFILTDVALRDSSQLTEDQKRYISDNIDTEAPLCYPEGMTSIRKEAIMLACVDFKSGGVLDLCQIYHRDGDSVILDECFSLHEKYPDGSMQSGIIDEVKEGYSKPEVSKDILQSAGGL